MAGGGGFGLSSESRPVMPSVALFGRTPPPTNGRRQRGSALLSHIGSARCSSSAMSSGRLFLDGMPRQPRTSEYGMATIRA